MLPCRSFRLTSHALQKMLERNIDEQDALLVLRTGQLIRTYPEDKPYVSHLLLGFVRGKALHVVGSVDELATCILITAYWPYPLEWNETFTQKRT